MSDPNFDLAREQMLRVQLRRREIRDDRVLSAMADVPREYFIERALRKQAYTDTALGIDCGQTISQPYIVALMTESLQLAGDETVLEIGTGSGYQTAILAEIAHEVISIERHAHLSNQAAERLANFGYQNVTLVVGDGTLGYPKCAPYSRILVAAAAAQCPPALWNQLTEGGILVMPIGPWDCQMLQAIRKIGGRPQITDLSACRFVPLIGS